MENELKFANVIDGNDNTQFSIKQFIEDSQPIGRGPLSTIEDLRPNKNGNK